MRKRRTYGRRGQFNSGFKLSHLLGDRAFVLVLREQKEITLLLIEKKFRSHAHKFNLEVQEFVDCKIAADDSGQIMLFADRFEWLPIEQDNGLSPMEQEVMQTIKSLQ